MSLRRVAVRVPAAEVEIVLATLLDLAPGGIEETAVGPDVELAVYVDAAGEECVRAAFPAATAADVPPGWEDAWRAFHRPAVVGGIWLGPPWETPPPGLAAVVIDPGRAFGTGAHPTTRLCIELLARVVPGSLLDVGCGSGVLSIAAARLGFGPLTALDVDPIAVDVTRANAAANGVALQARVADALLESLPHADVAVANVLLGPVERVLTRLEAAIAITSGYLDGDLPAHPGWHHADRLEGDAWAADAFTRA
jgi:ribosomal protein L11 methyltransferase